MTIIVIVFDEKHKWQTKFYEPRINEDPIAQHTCEIPTSGFIGFLLYEMFILGGCFYSCLWMHRLAGEMLESESRKVLMVAAAFMIINISFVPAYILSKDKVRVLVRFFFFSLSYT